MSVPLELPHFGTEVLEAALAESGVPYVWKPALGGRRRPTSGAPATARRSDGFEGFAEYLRTADFAEALDGLLNTIESSPPTVEERR
jgi:hypothetical protein